MGILAYGFGCYLDRFNFYDNWQEELIKNLPPVLKEEFDDAWELNKESYDSIEEFIPDYIENYDNTRGYYDFEALLADAINESEFGGKEIFNGSEMTLYAIPRFPREDEVIPCIEDVKAGLIKWLDVIGDNAEELEQ